MDPKVYHDYMKQIAKELREAALGLQSSMFDEVDHLGEKLACEGERIRR